MGGRACAGINREGIDYYNGLIDTIIANGMKPYVTLFHWDTPYCLEQEYDGFLSKKIVDDFRAYAELCFWEFGDRVKWWTTINEPLTYAVHGYVRGTFPPGNASSSPARVLSTLPPYKSVQRLDRTVPVTRSYSDVKYDKSDPAKDAYTVARNLLLAHSAVVHSYRTKFKFQLVVDSVKCNGHLTERYEKCHDNHTLGTELDKVPTVVLKFEIPQILVDIQHGQIGIVLNCNWAVPYDKDSDDDKAAATRAIDFMIGWFLEPVLYGRYPQTMIDSVPTENLAHFSQTEIHYLKGSVDYVGLNYYTANYVRYDPNPEGVGYDADQRLLFSAENKDGEEIGEPCGSTWLRIVPWGIYELLVYMKNTYPDLPPVYITENGCSEINDHTLTATAACPDPIRTKYHQDHLANILQAINTDNMDIRGYFAWSWCDNFEWTEGYTVRFGLTYIDYVNNYTRHPKNSALWFVKFLKGQLKLLSNKRQIEDHADNGGDKRPRLEE
ncbi:hypothetical protein CASFOL_017513 [Castilleja foliolosa]|uniref:Beta-glucosidase n=1 Tax=Castilleja foliolosa TaxID=1961234 RepID=A0ABD3DBA0_9LAMI